MSDETPYRLNFYFDYAAGGCLWPANVRAYRQFDVGPIDAIIRSPEGEIVKTPPEELKLSPETYTRIYELDDWYNTSLNQENPMAPSPWLQDECNRFNQASEELFLTISGEINQEFDVIYRQVTLHEDSRLADYLLDPVAFTSKKN